MKDRKLKSPNDYPLFGFRVKPETKDELADLLDGIWAHYNKSLVDDQKMFKKNEIFEKALKIGLRQMGRKKS